MTTRPTSKQGGRSAGRPGARTVRLVANDGRTYPLSIGSTVIGRGDQANLRLPDVASPGGTPGWTMTAPRWC